MVAADGPLVQPIGVRHRLLGGRVAGIGHPEHTGTGPNGQCADRRVGVADVVVIGRRGFLTVLLGSPGGALPREPACQVEIQLGGGGVLDVSKPFAVRETVGRARGAAGSFGQ